MQSDNTHRTLAGLTVFFTAATFVVMALQWMENRKLTKLQQEEVSLRLKKLKGEETPQTA